MTEDLRGELVACLADARAMELQALELLDRCVDGAGDDSIAAIYRKHRCQTEVHARDITERLSAHGQGEPTRGLADAASPDLELAVTSKPASAAKLARIAYAFANLEIAAYHLLGGLAQRAGDPETVALAQRILEEEEASAEVLASQLDRVLELSVSGFAR